MTITKKVLAGEFSFSSLMHRLALLSEILNFLSESLVIYGLVQVNLSSSFMNGVKLFR